MGDQAVVETAIPGDGLFLGGADVFQALSNLRDALALGDTDAVAAEAANVEQIARRFSQFRARVGFTLEELGRHRVHLGAERVEDQTSLGREIDADLVDAISRLSAGNTALEATLGAGARLLSVSLMDLIG